LLKANSQSTEPKTKPNGHQSRIHHHPTKAILSLESTLALPSFVQKQTPKEKKHSKTNTREKKPRQAKQTPKEQHNWQPNRNCTTANHPNLNPDLRKTKPVKNPNGIL
jgi:hypothetical protein